MKGDIYHIVNRGVDKRKIFLNDEDYFRFRDSLKDFNNKNRVQMSHFNRQKFNSERRVPNDKLLVDILAVCLMPSHYHLLAQEKVDSGVGLFTNKLGTGYTHCFNQKYERSGVLFQGRTKKILVNKDEHFMHLPYYIMGNPIRLIEKNWKEGKIKNKREVIKFLDKYKWVSFRDIVSDNEKGVFSEVINKKLFLKLFGFKTGEDFKNYFTGWIDSL